MVARLRHLGTLLVSILRSMWADSSWVYDIVVRGNLEALRKGSNMTECTTEGCGNEARVTVRRPTRKVLIAHDEILMLNGISVPVRAGEMVTVQGDNRLVCEECSDFLIAVGGFDRLRSVV